MVNDGDHLWAKWWHVATLNREGSAALAEKATKPTGFACPPNAEILLLGMRCARQDVAAEKPAKLCLADEPLDELSPALRNDRSLLASMKKAGAIIVDAVAHWVIGDFDWLPLTGDATNRQTLNSADRRIQGRLRKKLA